MILISGCFSNLQQNESRDINEQEVYRTIEAYIVKERHYLLYNVVEGEKQKEIEIQVPYKIQSLQIKKITLLQDNNVVSEELDQVKTLNNKLTIKMPYYIPQFNQMKATLTNNKIITLNIGQYTLENFTEHDFNHNNIKPMQITNNHLKFHNGKLESTTEFVKKDETEVEVKIPEAALKYIKNIQFNRAEQNGKIKYTLKCEISQSILTDYNLESAVVDISIVQNANEKKWSLIKSSVPIQTMDYQTKTNE
ncbi:hypothetical protein [Paenibacillus taiwanensis]|uniref:hypothetical protein n=1 Tax=Paenibacillus taiwanensis TaxID=401638 RepID=UPI0012F94AFA|nr:hypothetical protein [Paenibacillus taiwanensis]